MRAWRNDMGPRLWLVGVATAVLAGTVARLLCLGAEFWLDEIWSLELARTARSPFDVLFAARQDNNHHLNTIYLLFVPDGAWWGWYRLLSFVAGVLSIAMAARAARRWGGAEALLTAGLVACCSWLVLASSEARGYSLAVLFALIAYDALWGYLQTRSRISLVIYWLATIAGFLSHLTFLHATIGFVVWSLRVFARQRTSSGDELRQLALTHAVPGVVVAAFYLFAVRGMDRGGGPPAATFDVLASLIGRGLGGFSGWWALPWCLLAVALFSVGIWRLRNKDDDVWVFFVACCVVSPGLSLLTRPDYLFERYFLIPFVFFLLLASHAFAWLAAPRPTPIPADPSATPPMLAVRQVVFVVLLQMILIGNAVIVSHFADTGRGNFCAALNWAVARSDGVVHVRAEAPKGATFRVSKYVEFYAPRVAPGREVVVRDAEEPGVEWMLVHRLPGQPPPEEVLNGYRLDQSFPSRGPWAWGWFVYRRVKQPDVAEQ